jgi:gluconolactonase
MQVRAAAGNLGIGGGRFAEAQGAKRIERFDPALDAIIDVNEPIVDIATNLGGTANVESPLWSKEGGYLLFRSTDQRRWKYTPGQPIAPVKETNWANGITRDMQGRLVAWEALTRRIAREEGDGSITAGVELQGPFNRPNDIVVKSDGAIYFTDPWTAAEAPGETDMTFCGVFRISPNRDRLTLLVDDILRPNGIAFSPDESDLSRLLGAPPHPRVQSGAERHAPAPDRPHFRRPQRARARRARRHESPHRRNVYCGGSGGLYILDPNGKTRPREEGVSQYSGATGSSDGYLGTGGGGLLEC